MPVSEETGVKIEHALPGSNVLGMAKRIIVTKDTTTIIGGSATDEEIKARVTQLDNLIESTTDDYDREKLEERRAKLEGGVAVVYVGGKTESELKEKRDLVDDAFNAVKAALKNGIVAGGGVALLDAYRKLKTANGTTVDKLEGDEAIGASIFVDALTAPIKRILKNAGENADLIVEKIIEQQSYDVGYDVLAKK